MSLMLQDEMQASVLRRRQTDPDKLIRPTTAMACKPWTSVAGLFAEPQVSEESNSKFGSYTEPL